MEEHIDPHKTGHFIKELRSSNGLTQDELAQMVFVTRKAVSKWETGRSCPSIDVLKLLSDKFGVPLEDFLRGESSNTIKHNEKITFIQLVHSGHLKLRTLIFLSVFFVISVILLIFKLTSPVVYSISYQDKRFTITNGTLMLSPNQNYMTIGDIVSNVDDMKVDTELHFKLQIKVDNKYVTIADFNKTDFISIDKKSGKEVKKHLRNKNNHLYLKVEYITTKNKPKSYMLKLYIKTTPQFLRLENVPKNKNNDDTENSSTNETTNNVININFIINLSEDKLKDLNGKSFKVGKEKYKVEYINDEKGISFISKNYTFTLFLTPKIVTVNTDTVYLIKDQSIVISDNSQNNIDKIKKVLTSFQKHFDLLP